MLAIRDPGSLDIGTIISFSYSMVMNWCACDCSNREEQLKG